MHEIPRVKVTAKTVEELTTDGWRVDGTRVIEVCDDGSVIIGCHECGEPHVIVELSRE
jgi:hypothetical protein